ncbi:cutinase family protein [Gordonia jinhuaensis]|uniref:Hypothetical cutinase n=1 Tax=Gordonia jinhuaensis TaxID=1517702 RepID=A0A916TE75_9ACTN|nr:cutinase family protein [Gordonia jinhuaensis]GGB41652.1 hypothetical cutinase precursor [Gordonia jinhuaensis]
MSARRSSRRRTLTWVLLGVAALVVIAIILVIVLVVTLLRPSSQGPAPTPGAPTTSAPTATAQPADCPDVQVIAVPGTWESSADDDPQHPHANPNSLILKVSSTLQDEFDGSRADVYTTPYVAQFRNPTNLNDHQTTYNDSRAQGTQRTTDKIAEVHEHCPLTGFVLLGFSQGAVISGDIASQIGNGQGPIPADRLLGVGLIADGRRQPGEARTVGPDPSGVGAEVALGGIGKLVPGITMTGSRTGGFGSVADRTYSLCAPGDLICDSPTITNPLTGVQKLMGAINNPIHAMYATPKYWNINGDETAVQWMRGWARGVIEKAPHPPHN